MIVLLEGKGRKATGRWTVVSFEPQTIPILLEYIEDAEMLCRSVIKTFHLNFIAPLTGVSIWSSSSTYLWTNFSQFIIAL